MPTAISFAAIRNDKVPRAPKRSATTQEAFGVRLAHFCIILHHPSGFRCCQAPTSTLEYEAERAPLNPGPVLQEGA